jgi:hypothetical protein
MTAPVENCGSSTQTAFAGARLLEPIHLDRYELLALELGIEDPPQPAAELKLEQVAGYGLTAARASRDLRQLTEDPSRFKVFAFVSSMLNPRAGREFRRLRRHQEFRTKHNQRTGRDLKHGHIGKKKYTTDAQLEKRAERIAQIAEDLWWSPNASIKSISSGRGLGPPPQWIQRFWQGDTPLEQMYAVPCVSRSLSAEDFIPLVKRFGYDGIAAWTSVTHAVLQSPPDRRRAGEVDEMGMRVGTNLSQPRPYIPPPSPDRLITRYGKYGGGFTLAQVEESVGKMRTNPSTRAAVIEVVYARRSPRVVAQAYGIPWKVLKNYAIRARKRIKRKA